MTLAGVRGRRGEKGIKKKVRGQSANLLQPAHADKSSWLLTPRGPSERAEGAAAASRRANHPRRRRENYEAHKVRPTGRRSCR